MQYLFQSKHLHFPPCGKVGFSGFPLSKRLTSLPAMREVWVLVAHLHLSVSLHVSRHVGSVLLAVLYPSEHSAVKPILVFSVGRRK